MILWSLGFALVAMWVVFRDPAIDHRIVLVGVLLPFAIDIVIGRPTILHTLLGSILLLMVVMAATVGRRQQRRRWLGLPIGTFLFLVAGGIWADRSLFWWPLDGARFEDRALPTLDRPLWAVLALEALGVMALGWAWFRYGLDDAERRRVFIRTGRIDRRLTEPGEPPSC